MVTGAGVKTLAVELGSPHVGAWQVSDATGPILKVTRETRAVDVAGDIAVAGALDVTGSLTVPAPYLGMISATVGYAEFTDGGGASGTYELAGEIPAGALLQPIVVLLPAGFAGDTSAVLIVGDGTDTDRLNTGTIDVFTTDATGVNAGSPSGALYVKAAFNPVLTITSGSDWGAVNAGSVTVKIPYLMTV